MAFVVVKIGIHTGIRPLAILHHYLFQLACVLLVQCEVCHQYGLHYFRYYVSTESSFWRK